MRTFLWVVVAFVLGALVAHYLVPALRGTESPTQVRETHEALVTVETAGSSDNCKVKTYSPIMSGRAGDDFTWTILAVGDCADYVADVQIATKNPTQSGELDIPDSSPGASRRAFVRAYPGRCQHQPPPCKIPYKVTVTSRDPSRPGLTEDPRIDIWR